MINRTQAREILDDMIKNPSLHRHCLSVGMVMEAYAKKLGEDADEWYITGILHDADYEMYPDKHPNIIVEKMRSMGEEKIAHAISAHYTKWNVPYNTLLDKALLACDELTGFIIAAALIRPTKLEGLSAKSVKKKFKNPKFAAGVERDEVMKGVELMNVDFTEHINFIVSVLQAHDAELEL